jgi:molecular chaperone GrpE
MTDETRKAHAAEAADARPANDDAARMAAGGDGAEAAPEPTAPRPTVEEQAAELKDRLLRTLAEMENLRGRTAREIEDARKYAVTGFARDVLEVADNLGRALASVPQEARETDEAVRNLMLGVEMTQRSLLTALEKHKVRRVAPQKGDRFDPNLHQAMFEVPTDQQAPGTIAEVMQAGYVLADRLLRPALVGVAKAANGQAQPAAKVDTTA